eukprot:TRINITY_DN55565_c0_g1_i1.p1 TRINITY_DN55565_c0_g1~~TRINITY_DN55565_c0_g1_i1.p1  ORF type:complete len:465 (-),score=40.65 TRINITY_DN55565_c0_g1_i1:204-1526(-)
MSASIGFAAALGAAIAFGVQYVPVKNYAIYDGTTFQWFMCSGILFVGLASAMITGDIERGCSPMVMFGGGLWALSNFAVLPLVKLLGIGLGFSLYHFVNMVIGYCTGRFGIFGVPPVEDVFPNSLFIADFGCFLVCCSFVCILFVETAAAPAPPSLEPAIVSGIDEVFREAYHQWRRGKARGSRDVHVSALLDESNLEGSSLIGSSIFAAGGFSMHSQFKGFGIHGEEATLGTVTPNISNGPSPNTDSPASASRHLTRSSSAPILPVCTADVVDDVPNGQARQRSKIVLGVLLAVVGGGLAAVQSVPAALYNVKHPSDPPTAVFLPQCLGIWGVSCAIYLVYSTIAKLQRWPVPHSVIRPAFFSGMIWAIGFILMITGIRDLGYSIGYTLDAVGPIAVSSVLSICWFKEIKGRRPLMIYFGAEMLQVVGVVLIVAFGKQP